MENRVLLALFAAAALLVPAESFTAFVGLVTRLGGVAAPDNARALRDLRDLRGRGRFGGTALVIPTLRTPGGFVHDRGAGPRKALRGSAFGGSVGCVTSKGRRQDNRFLGLRCQDGGGGDYGGGDDYGGGYDAAGDYGGCHDGGGDTDTGYGGGNNAGDGYGDDSAFAELGDSAPGYDAATDWVMLQQLGYFGLDSEDTGAYVPPAGSDETLQKTSGGRRGGRLGGKKGGRRDGLKGGRSLAEPRGKPPRAKVAQSIFKDWDRWSSHTPKVLLVYCALSVIFYTAFGLLELALQ